MAISQEKQKALNRALVRFIRESPENRKLAEIALGTGKKITDKALDDFEKENS